MNNIKNIIVLTQVRVKNGEFIESPTVVNTDYFVRASEEELTPDVVPIIGQTKPEMLTQVSLSDGSKPLVRETTEEVYNKIVAAGRPEGDVAVHVVK